VTVQDIRPPWRISWPRSARHSFSFRGHRHAVLEPAAPADFELLQHAEHLIASSIGAASSRLVMSLLLRNAPCRQGALKLLDDSHARCNFNRQILQTALNHVRQGIAVFDRRPAADLFPTGVSATFSACRPTSSSSGIPLKEILGFMGAISPPGFGDSATLMESGWPPIRPRASRIWSGCRIVTW